ncbi:TPA: hypothetical protein ACNVP4_006717, partial [Pseudomonas aeruginosa]
MVSRLKLGPQEQVRLQLTRLAKAPMEIQISGPVVHPEEGYVQDAVIKEAMVDGAVLRMEPKGVRAMVLQARERQKEKIAKTSSEMSEAGESGAVTMMGMKQKEKQTKLPEESASEEH